MAEESKLKVFVATSMEFVPADKLCEGHAIKEVTEDHVAELLWGQKGARFQAMVLGDKKYLAVAYELELLKNQRKMEALVKKAGLWCH